MTPVNIVQANALGKQVISPEGTLTILDDINLSIKEGESLAIIGVSGSGKSTLLGLLAGLDTPTQGNVTLDGTDLSKLDEDGRAKIRAQSVGFVFQSFHLLPGLTALENASLALELADNDNAMNQAKEKLEQVGLAERLHHYPNQLSGGEQQRVAIARALLNDPELILADEPTGNLDPKTSLEVMELLNQIHQSGKTILMATHDYQLIVKFKQKTIKCEGGQLFEVAQQVIV